MIILIEGLFVMGKIKKYKVRGITVYSTPKLNEDLKEIVMSSKFPSQYRSIFLKLIENEKLVAVTTTKNLLQKLLKKITRHRFDYDVLGTTTSKRMYIFADEFKNVTTSHVINTIIHESIHFAFFQNYSQAFKINLKLFFDFYADFYKEYLQSSKFDNKLFNTFLSKLGVQDKTAQYRDSNYKFLDDSFRPYSQLNEQEFDKRMIDLMNYIFKYDSTRNGKFPKIAALIKRTYRKNFGGFDNNSYVGLEMYYPSEIISVLSSINLNHPNVAKTLKILS